MTADEAHRSQYDFLGGLARHMRDALPRTSFTGFTGTPRERKEANTRAVFGDSIDIHDVKQAVDDPATVSWRTMRTPDTAAALDKLPSLPGDRRQAAAAKVTGPMARFRLHSGLHLLLPNHAVR